MRVPVIYTMGKVASRSIALALQATGRRFHDIHTLDQEFLAWLARDRLDKGMPIDVHVCSAIGWRNEIVDTGRCLYISLVRDPIERNVAAAFQNIDTETLGSPDDLLKAVMAYSHSLPAVWFDREFRKQLGINVFRTPFDKVNRYVRTEQFLIMRTDLDDEAKSRVLEAATGIFPIEVGRRNVGANKKRYHGVYEGVRGNLRFPAEFVDSIYETPFARHFWTTEELDRFRVRWTTGASVDSLMKMAS